MIQGILTEAPVWVWPLFAFLLFAGLRATRPRQMPIVLMYVFPFLGIMALIRVAALSDPLVAWTCFGLGYVAGIILAHALQGRWIIERQGWRISVVGEWFTLLTLMIIFWANFANGFIQAVHPDLQTHIGFIAVFAFVLGWVSGSFLGRTIRILRT